jgi:hypothetical protein
MEDRTQFKSLRLNPAAILLALLMLLAWPGAALAQTLTINVVDAAGNPIGAGFRWLVEEDATKDVDFTPAQPGRDLSLSFHTSYMPVAGKGTSASATIDLDPSKRYFVSVLPDSGYQMGGAPVARGQTAVTVTLTPAPIPTAQISVSSTTASPSTAPPTCRRSRAWRASASCCTRPAAPTGSRATRSSRTPSAIPSAPPTTLPATR